MTSFWVGTYCTVVNKTDVDLTLIEVSFHGKADIEQVKHINKSLQIVVCAKKEKEQDAVGKDKS